jgi:hypothetical protein
MEFRKNETQYDILKTELLLTQGQVDKYDQLSTTANPAPSRALRSPQRLIKDCCYHQSQFSAAFRASRGERLGVTALGLVTGRRRGR